MELFKRFKKLFISLEPELFTFILSASFYASLLLVNSNRVYLLLTLLYLIILLIKLQNWRLCLWLTAIAILPFIRGRNLLEITLIPRKEITGLSIYDVKYFWPVYLGDLFLLLLFQSYFSAKLKKKNEQIVIDRHLKIALLSLLVIILVVASKGLNHQYSSFLIFSSFLMMKYGLLLFSPLIVKGEKKHQLLVALLAAATLFQSLVIFIEQIRGGNLGKFIENSSVANLGTASAESSSLLRANGTFNEANITAIFLLMGVSLILPLALKHLKKRRIHYYLIISVLATIAIVLTGSRSLYFLSALYFLWQYLMNQQLINQYLKLTWKQTFIKVLLLAIVLIMSPYFWQRLKSLPDAFTPKGSFSYRLELNRHSILLGKEKIWLGIGLDMTPYYLAKTYKTIDASPVIFDQAPAHNILIQIFTELGIIGLTAFILLLASVWRQAFQKKDWPHNNFLVASLAFFIGAQFHPVFSNHSELTGFFFLFLGIILDQEAKQKHSRGRHAKK